MTKRKRLRKGQESKDVHINLTREVREAVEQVASEDGGSVSLAVDTLLREALAARALEEARYKVKTAELESLMGENRKGVD